MKNRIRTTIIPFLFVISLLTSCQGDRENTNQDLSEKNANENASLKTSESRPAIGTVKDDTLYIGGKFVLFFGPAETTDTSRKQFQEAITTFKAGSYALIDSLLKYPDVKTVYTTASYFKIYNPTGSDMVVSKTGFSEIVGVVVCDGYRSPTIKKGFSTTSEYHKFLKDYFRLK